jgi:hypothetical protein
MTRSLTVPPATPVIVIVPIVPLVNNRSHLDLTALVTAAVSHGQLWALDRG